MKPRSNMGKVKAAYPEAVAIDLEGCNAKGKYVYYAVVDGDDSDGVLGTGSSVRDAWAQAADRLDRNLGYL